MASFNVRAIVDEVEVAHKKKAASSRPATTAVIFLNAGSRARFPSAATRTFRPPVRINSHIINNLEFLQAKNQQRACIQSVIIWFYA